MTQKDKESLVVNMVDNLPTLRKKLDMSQEKLAGMLGVSRSTVAAIENKKRALSWTMFLSLVLVFSKNKETDKLLNVMDIYTDEFNAFIKNRL